MQYQNSKPHQFRSKTLQDAKDLFLNRRTGHLGYLQYGSPEFTDDPVHGATLWSKLRFIPEYYLARDDDTLLADVITDLVKSNVQVSSVIDLGPGDVHALESKTLPLVKALKASQYIAVDMCKLYATESAYFMAASAAITSQSYMGNFLEDALEFNEVNTLMFMGGSTISNIPVDIHTKDATLYLSAQLAKLRTSVDASSYLLIGFDANQDQESLNAAYQNKTHGRLVEDILWRLARDTRLDIQATDFRYHGEWMPDEHRYAHCVKVENDCAFSIQGKTVSLEQGQILHMDNSYKFPVELLTKAAENANWHVQNIWTRTQKAHYILLQAV